MADPAHFPRVVKPLRPWACPLAIATAVVFCISTVFPIAASLMVGRQQVTRFWGVLDVVVAFTLAFMAITIAVITDGRVTERAEKDAYRAYRVLMNGILVSLVIFLLGGGRIVWSVGLVGIGWRTWLLLYTLPAWITALRSRAEPQ